MRPALLALPLALALLGCSPSLSTSAVTSAPSASPRAAGQTGTAAPGSRTPRARPSKGAPGDFDFYLLTLSWSPEFCSTHRSAAECAAHAGFVLHGLWPQNTNGTYPENCSDAPGPSNPQQYSDIFPDPGLLQHEWKTHGTCSGLAPDAYLQLARRAFQSVHTPDALNNLSQQTSEPPATILGQFAAANTGVPQSSLALSCGNNYLTAVEVCLSKDLHAISCQVRTCAAQSVKIVPRGVTN